MEDKSIVLIGFMGVGKTSIGTELAKKLQWGLIDTDERIEQQFKMSTSKIFLDHGEEIFRKAESELIEQLSAEEKQILSLGGGAFLNSKNREVCLQNSTVVLIELSWEKWLDRYPLIKDTRPKLNGLSTDEMYHLYKERQAHYQPYHLKINVDGKTTEEAAELIISGIR